MNLNIKEAKRNLIEILQGEWLGKGDSVQALDLMRSTTGPSRVKRATPSMIYRRIHFIRRDCPYIHSVGTNQIVFDVGGGFLAKASLEKCFALKPQSDATKTKSYRLVPFTVGDRYVIFSGFDHDIPNNVALFRELGYRVIPHVITDMERDRSSLFFVEGQRFAFVPNLEGGYMGKGRWSVIADVNDESLSRLVNGNQIGYELRGHVAHLTKIYQGTLGKGPTVGDIKLQISSHVSGHGPDEALSHVFFVAVDHAVSVGSLVVGDVDHVVLYKQNGTVF